MPEEAGPQAKNSAAVLSPVPIAKAALAMPIEAQAHMLRVWSEGLEQLSRGQLMEYREVHRERLLAIEMVLRRNYNIRFGKSASGWARRWSATSACPMPASTRA